MVAQPAIERADYRFDSLEGLRAILAWWVVAAHLLQHSRVNQALLPAPFDPLWVGILPVYGFMILSGFVITHLVSVKSEPYDVYIFRRYMRLAPVMGVAVILALVIQLMGYPRLWPDEDLALRLLAQASLLHGLVPDTVYPLASQAFSGPAWSISLEWQFYLLAPLLIAGMTRRLWSAALLTALALALVYAVGARYDFSAFGIAFEYNKPSYLAPALVFFLAGIALYWARGAWIAERRWQAALTGAAVLMMLWLPTLWIYKRFDWLIPVQGAVILALILFNASPWLAPLRSRVLTWLGRISFSTYLLHIPVIYVVQMALRPETDWGYPLLWRLAAISIPLILLVSAVSYYGVERPAIRWAARKAAQRMEKRKGARPETSTAT